MKPTEELKNEHQAILLALRVLEEVSRRLNKGIKVDPGDLAGLVEFIRVFADKCHHAKEENLLFSEMEKAGMPRAQGPIGVMLSEHDQGRAYVHGMDEAARRLKAGDDAAGRAFAENAGNYAALLSQHIMKEDNILYPMADRILSEEAQRALEKGFEIVECDVVGAGRHEEFHRFLERMQEAYLGKA